MSKWFNSKMHRAKLHGQKIVIDCSFETYMTNLERFKLMKDLERLYRQNRKHRMPLDLHFCGVSQKSQIIQSLSDRIPTLLKKSSPIGIHTECFTEMYQKERLVILTPDSDSVLDYSFDDIYVMGGIVDLGRNDALTLSKAKKFGIRTARLPLDYVRMKPGLSKRLGLSSVASVIRERQIDSDWDRIIKKCVYSVSNF